MKYLSISLECVIRLQWRCVERVANCDVIVLIRADPDSGLNTEIKRFWKVSQPKCQFSQNQMF